MEKNNDLILFVEEASDPEELKQDIEAAYRLLADLKRKLYIAEHKGKNTKKMKKLLKEEGLAKKDREEWIQQIFEFNAMIESVGSKIWNTK